jgi:hypothetical protein
VIATIVPLVAGAILTIESLVTTLPVSLSMAARPTGWPSAVNSLRAMVHGCVAE